MRKPNMVSIDGNEAAHVAHQINEIIAIYPITPASPMGEISDERSARGMKNIWGVVPDVIEMQSEGGAAGAVHGALQAGALTTTFTASQGLLLMIPNMYKVAGKLTPTVIHVAARSLAAQALIAQAATLEGRIPVLHFFDGFRTSHEVAKVDLLEAEILTAMLDDASIQQHRARAMTPVRPVLRGSSQNPDVYFQGRESINRYYDQMPGIVQRAMDRFARLTGRDYRLFEYHGAADASKVIILMGSGAETAHETVDHLNHHGDALGILKVRLYRPFSPTHLLAALPASTRRIAVLDRTKEPGSDGEPLYKDVVTALARDMSSAQPRFEQMPLVIGGRYGLSSKEFTPGMVKGIFAELDKDQPKNNFSAGIIDDLTQLNLDWDADFRSDGWAYDIGFGGLTTPWLPVATSISWYWIPRCIPIPAARCPRPRPPGQSPSSLPVARP